jgi:hypothetical protein
MGYGCVGSGVLKRRVLVRGRDSGRFFKYVQAGDGNWLCCEVCATVVVLIVVGACA